MYLRICVFVYFRISELHSMMCHIQTANPLPLSLDRSALTLQKLIYLNRSHIWMCLNISEYILHLNVPEYIWIHLNTSEHIADLNVPEHIWIYLNTSEYISHMDVPEYIWIHLNTSHIWMCLNISELYWSVTAIQSNLLPIVRSGTTLYPQTILCLTVT